MWREDAEAVLARYPEPYLRRIAMAYGVPIFWLEDCIEEMRVELCRKPRRNLHHVAIDYARRYGPLYRSGRPRPIPLYFGQLAEGELERLEGSEVWL